MLQALNKQGGDVAAAVASWAIYLPFYLLAMRQQVKVQMCFPHFVFTQLDFIHFSSIPAFPCTRGNRVFWKPISTVTEAWYCTTELSARKKKNMTTTVILIIRIIWQNLVMRAAGLRQKVFWVGTCTSSSPLEPHLESKPCSGTCGRLNNERGNSICIASSVLILRMCCTIIVLIKYPSVISGKYWLWVQG